MLKFRIFYKDLNKENTCLDLLIVYIDAFNILVRLFNVSLSVNEITPMLTPLQFGRVH